jgi:hypothetical protein
LPKDDLTMIILEVKSHSPGQPEPSAPPPDAAERA